MIKHWVIDYTAHYALSKKGISTTTSIEGHETADEAKAVFLAKHPEAQNVKVRLGYEHCETYIELIAWLRKHNVTPREAQGGVQVMVLNMRKEPTPWLCEKCGFDINKGHDHVGNAYSCPKCHEVFQTG